MPFLLTLVLAAAEPAATSSPSPPAPAPARSSLQQDFNAANAALEKGDCLKALPLYETLERNPKVKPGSLPAATIAVRKGRCLIRAGRIAEAEAPILTGLLALEKAGADFAVDVAEGYQDLGDISMRRLDYAGARERYETALASVTGPARLPVLARLAKATAFDPGPAPLAHADEGLAILAAQPKPSKDLQAAFRTLRARILLNRGLTNEAYAELKQALALSGGLTLKTTLSEVSLRGDLGLAAMLLGKKDDARKYLAYTGAGRIKESPFGSAIAMEPPECSENTGLTRDDFAVVEFAIETDGSVIAASTVYSRGGPDVAAAFAQAVRGWYWRPEAVAKIPPFYRASTRIELRCSAAGGPTPGVMSPLFDRFGQWAAANLKIESNERRSRPEFIAAWREELSAREKSGDIAGVIAATGILVINDPRTTPELIGKLDRAIAASGKASTPVEISNTLRVLRLLMQPSGRSSSRQTKFARADPEQLLGLASDPAVAGDAIASSTLRLLAAAPQYGRRDYPHSSTLLQQVADEERLPAGHPLRQYALLKLANRAVNDGYPAAAQAFFQRTGLTEQQCAMLGVAPKLIRSGASASDFPLDAMAYGFAGWVNLEYDISADGRAVSARPVIAYPPFVFVEAATGMTKDMRYETSYRPGGGAACSAKRQTISFGDPAKR